MTEFLQVVAPFLLLLGIAIYAAFRKCKLCGHSRRKHVNIAANSACFHTDCKGISVKFCDCPGFSRGKAKDRP